RIQLSESASGVSKDVSPQTDGRVTIPVTATIQTRNGPRQISYQVRVFGGPFEETVPNDVTPAAGDRMLTIPLKRKPEGTAGTSTPGSGSTVSLGRLKVPDNARKELDRGND